MRRITYRPYILLGLFLFSLLSLPQKTSEKMRAAAIFCVTPSWEGFHFLKNGCAKLLAAIPGERFSQDNEEMQRLEQENQILRSQMQSVKEWLVFEERVKEQLDRIKEISHLHTVDPYWKEFFKRRTNHLASSLNFQMQSLYAKVIFREPSSWNSSLWLNVGQKDNERLGRIIVAKNSPVILGTSIVGVVEHVAARQSRVRLISDSGLVPSVRATRGSEQNHHIVEHIDTLTQSLLHRDDLFNSPQESSIFLQALTALKKRLSATKGDYYLAKGELCGSQSLLFRSKSHVLRGKGFNFDFSDEEGPARDLRTGEILGSLKGEAIPVLKVGDLLVTTGMDGVFPPGFKVAVVTKVGKLREGACAYDLEAKATAGNLDELTHLFVLPPMEFDRPSSSFL